MIIGKSITALGCGGLKPEIRVTAKAGALLNLHYKDSSIILQSYQLGAEETQHTFVVSLSETAYMVEDATNTGSVEVLVDAVAVFEAEIEYVLWLYKDGNPYEDITGGWIFDSTHNVWGEYESSGFIDNDCLRFYNNDTGVYTLMTANAIDITNYSKYCCEVITNQKYCGRGLSTNSNKAQDFTVVSANFEQGDGIIKTIQELDISSKTGNVFAWFLNGNSNAACVYKVFKVWLE